MKIHEYQTKNLLQQFGVTTPLGFVAASQEEALAAVDKIASYPLALKAQIHAGGRGKGGGIRLAHNRSEAAEIAEELLGKYLVTPQTGPGGRKVRKILVEQGCAIERELYFSIIVDRARAAYSILASGSGGMDIEELAAESPEKILNVPVNPLVGLQPYHYRQLAFGLDLTKEQQKEFSTILKACYTIFTSHDCMLLEINPLVVTSDSRLVALDAKVEFDDNGLFRHKELLELHDPDEEDPLELEAARFDLNYISMPGNVGNMVNGAGLAMATMDIIKQAGAEPANFLDVGGGANAEMVENGFRIIQSDENVKAILINIFGGILRCDVLASGVVEAAKKAGLTVPVVIRMEGTNVEKGRQILADAGLNLISASDLEDASGKIAAALQKVQ